MIEKKLLFDIKMDERNKKLLDSIIEYLNPRFNKIENEISSLKSDVSTINKYILTESKRNYC